MSDILHYIAEHPFFSLILLGIVVLAFGLAPFSSSSTENKRSAIINKHYNDNFKKWEGLNKVRKQILEIGKCLSFLYNRK